MRACIGRPFAWQEALLAVAVLLQNFDFRLHDPSYELAIKSTLTIKPKDFYMHASLRYPDGPILSTGMISSRPQSQTIARRDSGIGADTMQPAEGLPSLTILYGSNTGTCESLANELAKTAGERGINSHIEILDKATGNVPNDQPVVIITASYEGEPPDNATHFLSWLKGLQGLELSGVQYAVFGCGNSMSSRISILFKITMTANSCSRKAIGKPPSKKFPRCVILFFQHGVLSESLSGASGILVGRTYTKCSTNGRMNVCGRR